MIYAIVMKEAAPPVLIEAYDTEILQKLSEHALRDLASLQDAKDWLATLPRPSGVFLSMEAAKEAIQLQKIEKDAELVAKALALPGMTQIQLTEYLGLGGPDNDGKAVRRILLKKQGLSGPSRRLLAYLFRDGAVISKATESTILKRQQ